MEVPPEFATAPQRIGRFILRRELGSGLTSRVFLAYDPHLERQVAIKWLSPAADLATASLHEARVVARLKHPNIVPLHEAGVFRTSAYLVFAHIDGVTLREAQATGGPMPPATALPVFRAILDGVACAHAQGILHLDLSPSNIIVDTAGVPHVMDFGQARIASDGGARGGALVGTPRYMSPEQFERGPLTARTDVHALGLLLYGMLTGGSPLPGDSVAAIAAALTGGKLDLGGMDGLEPRLQAVLRRALRRDPGARFADAGEMKRALDEFSIPGAQGRAHGTVEFLIRRMQRKANFPALSNNLLEINRLTGEDSRARVENLAQVVLRDYAITNRLLKLANSSFYGRSAQGVTTVSEAIHLLGTRVIRMTCNSLMYLNAMRGGPARLRDALIGSFVSALISRHLAIHIGRRDLAEEAFICGMFHNLGKSLAIFYFEDEFEEIERLVESGALAEEAAAARVFGIGYSELGMAVAARWKFPATICESIRCPGAGRLPPPGSLVEAQRQLAAFASELCELAERCPHAQAGAALSEFAARFEALAGIAAGDLPELLRSAFDKLAEFSPVLGLDLGSSRFLRRSGEFLAALALPVELAPHA